MTIRNLLALAVLPIAFAACGGATPPVDAPKPEESAAPAVEAPAAPADAAKDAAGEKKADDAAPAAADAAK
jgi:hypothetical protein